ncbi:hypothetical protein BGZ58_002836, partial [Dissophora ornata]
MDDKPSADTGTSIFAGASADTGPFTVSGPSTDLKDVIIKLSERSTSWEFRDAFCTLVNEQLKIAEDEAIKKMSPGVGPQDV